MSGGGNLTSKLKARLTFVSTRSYGRRVRLSGELVMAGSGSWEFRGLAACLRHGAAFGLAPAFFSIWKG